MYDYIKGEVIKFDYEGMVLECNGIGYSLLVPLKAEGSIPSPGDFITVYTYLTANDSGIYLYGFLTPEERGMFLRLITVSGIGPKGAISILNTLSIREIATAIINDDEKAISKAPGIGPKTAKRMIVDLKDKMKNEEIIPDMPFECSTDFSDAGKDAVAALCALGFSCGDAKMAVESVYMEGLSTEELLSLALKEL